jgi:hypothetical protein
MENKFTLSIFPPSTGRRHASPPQSIDGPRMDEAFSEAFNWILLHSGFNFASTKIASENSEGTLSVSLQEKAFIYVVDANTAKPKSLDGSFIITVAECDRLFQLQDEQTINNLKELWKKAVISWENSQILTNQKKLQAEQDDRYQRAWVIAFSRPWAIANPANGLAFTAFIASLLLIIAHFKPEAMLLPGVEFLVPVAFSGVIFSGVTILFFTPWEAYKHYKAWKKAHAESNNLIHINDLNVIDYASNLFGLPQWIKDHTLRAIIVGVGILISLAMLGMVLGFFGGNETCIQVMKFLFNQMHQVLNSFSPLVGQVVAAIFAILLPLIIVDAYRRLSSTREEARRAAGYIGGNEHGYDPESVDHDMDHLARKEFEKDFIKPVKEFWKELGQQSPTPQKEEIKPIAFDDSSDSLSASL